MTAQIFIKEWVMAIVNDFIEQNWSVFEQYCKDMLVNPDEIAKEFNKIKREEN